MVGQKANEFLPSAKRLVRRMAPERNKALAVVALAVASVALMSLGPKILGRATDLIFAGVLGKQLEGNVPAGTPKDQVVEHLQQSGNDKQASMIASMKDFVVGQGVDFTAVGHVLLLVLAVYAAGSLLAWLQGYLLNDVVQGTIFRMRSEVEDKVNALPLSYFDQQPRGELLSRVTNDIDNVSQTLQQTMSQLMTSLLTVVFVVAFMFSISWELALVALVTVPITMVDHRRGDEAQPGDVHRPVAAYRTAQRPHRGDVLGQRAGEGLRPPAGGRADLRRGEREALRGVVRGAVRQRPDHADDDVHREPQLRRDRRARRAQGRERVDLAR